MAQTNFTPILLYSSSTPTNAPSAGNLTNSANGSEIAINIADKNLFFKDSGGVVNTVPIRQSSASSNGWLSSTDWSTFNSKAPATSGTSILYGNGSGGFSNVTIGSGISFSGGTLSATGTGGTVTSVAALTLGTAGTDLSSTVANGTTTPVITLNVPTASAANRGALSAADWSTFNGKQAALVSGTNIKTVGGVTLLGSGDVGTIGTGYGGTGLTSFTSGGILYASSTSALTTGAGLTYSSGVMAVQTTLNVGGGGTDGVIGITRASGATLGTMTWVTATDQFQFNNNNGGIYTWRINSTEYMRMFASGGVSIGNTTDPGATNLSVTGIGYFGTPAGLGSKVQIVSGTAPGVNVYVSGASTDATAAYVLSKVSTTNTSDQVFQEFWINTYGTASGRIVANGASAAAFAAYSDRSLKEKITALPSQLANILALQPVEFDYKDGSGHQVGFIAQDFEKVYPDAVSANEKGILSIAGWSKTEARLVKALQELNDKFDAYVASHP